MIIRLIYNPLYIATMDTDIKNKIKQGSMKDNSSKMGFQTPVGLGGRTSRGEGQVAHSAELDSRRVKNIEGWEALWSVGTACTATVKPAKCVHLRHLCVVPKLLCDSQWPLVTVASGSRAVPGEATLVVCRWLTVGVSWPATLPPSAGSVGMRSQSTSLCMRGGRAHAHTHAIKPLNGRFRLPAKTVDWDTTPPIPFPLHSAALGSRRSGI